jgi:hypothetical protein
MLIIKGSKDDSREQGCLAAIYYTYNSLRPVYNALVLINSYDLDWSAVFVLLRIKAARVHLIGYADLRNNLLTW